MSIIAVYAEKPDVASKIAWSLGKTKTRKNGTHFEFNYNGDTYKVTWGFGHLCTLKQAYDYNPEYKNWNKIPLPYFPDEYEIKIKTDAKGKTDAGAKKQLKIISDIFKSSDYIINATDDDREGELIFAYVYQILKSKKPYKRVFLDSYTDEAIMKAFANLKDMKETKNVENAGRSKSIADWMLGANLTSIMSLKYSSVFKAFVGPKKAPVVNIGRVQTPTLNMIVEREREIANFKPETTFGLKARFTTSKGETYLGEMKNDFEKDKLKFETLQKELQKLDGNVTIYNVRDKLTNSPLLYNLSSLQVDANKLHRLTAGQTLEIAQKLYSDGYTTYPRTSSAYLPEDMKMQVHQTLDLLEATPEFGHLVKLVPKSSRIMSKNHFNDAKVESHYAIIPTNKLPDLSKLSLNELNVYKLIAHSLIRSVFPAAKSQTVKIETRVKDVDFVTTGTTIIDESWMVVGKVSKKEDSLPVLTIGEKVFAEPELAEKTTRPPNRFNDSSLILAMTNAGKDIEDKELVKFLFMDGRSGIGTPATRAGIIDNLISNGFAKRVSKNIVPTDKGFAVIDNLPIDELKSPKLSAQWEEKLYKIEKGELAMDVFIKDFEYQVSKWTNKIKEEKIPVENKQGATGLKCPNCGKAILENSYGFFCSGNNRNDATSCQFRLFRNNKSNFKPDMSINDLTSLISTGRTLVHKGKSAKGEYEFMYELSADKQSTSMVYPERAVSNTNVSSSEFTCPICEKELNHIVNPEEGWDFYSCPDRHVLVGAERSGYTLTKEDIQKLLEGKIIGPVPMVSSKGQYEAKLYLDMATGKIQRDFS